MWVFGALIPVIFTLPARLGFLVLSIAAGLAALSYMFGANSETSSSPETTFSVVKNLLKNKKSEKLQETVEIEKEISPDQTITEREIFTPYPQDEDDDNLKLF